MTHDHPTTIAVCPRCQSQLALPAAAPADAQLECPVCAARFALAGVAVRALPMARLAAAPEPAPFAWSLPDPAASGVHVLDPTRLEPTPPEPTPLEIAATLIAKAPSLVPSEAPDLPGDDPFDPGAATLPMTHEATIKLADDLRLESRNGADDLSAGSLPSSPASVDEPADASTATVPLVPDDFAATIAELEGPAESAASDPPDDEAPDDWTETDSDPDADKAHEPFALQPGSPRRRRKPSSVRMVAGLVVFGAIGLLLGAYALLWIKGARGDVFQLASHLPSWLLPPSMQLADQAGDPSVGEAGERSTGDAAPTAEADSDALLADAADAVVTDPEVTPAAADAAAAEDDDAVVPATAETSVDEPPAPAVNWPVTAILGDVTDLQTSSLAELDERLSAGEAAAERFIAGDLSQRESVREVGQAYIELCALAEAFTLLEPATYGTDLFTKQALAKAALRAAAAPAQRADLAVVAAKWLGHDRRTNQGALFVGTVRDLGVQGRWTESVIEVGDGKQSAEVHVLTDGIKFTTGAAAGIAGAIIDHPQERIAGYQGDAAQVVIAGFTFDPATVVDDASPAVEFPLSGE